jgi:hypothetical protein
MTETTTGRPGSGVASKRYWARLGMRRTGRQPGQCQSESVDPFQPRKTVDPAASRSWSRRLGWPAAAHRGAQGAGRWRI